MLDRVRIKAINIKYFRSIISMNIDVKNLNMFIGLNDVGKSNVLKALNLFFNGQTDYNTLFEFDRDFSKLFPEKSKKAKEITIKISFDVPENYKGSGEYIWEKRWRSEGLVKDDINLLSKGGVSNRSKIPTLLKKIRYRYIPAVKSNDYYKWLLVELYRAVSSSVDSPLRTSADAFSQTLKEYTINLSELILNQIGLASKLSLPKNFSDIFETLMFQTKDSETGIEIPLTQRGDGIQARHIPIVLKYISDEDYNSSNTRGAVKIYTIWGFEEPENGLEMLKAFDMAREFVEYSEEVQIFITTHSPAFYSKKSEINICTFYVSKSDDTEATIVTTNPDKRVLDKNLGLLPFIAPYIAEKQSELERLNNFWKNNPLTDIPTILVEGKTDKIYLELAIQDLSKTLHRMIENRELRILTREENGAGTTLIQDWVISWLYSRNTSKMMAIFDKDSQGKKAEKKIKKSERYNNQNKGTSTKVILLKPSPAIVAAYTNKLHIPYEIEHLLSNEIWIEAKKKGFVEERTYLELVKAYKGEFPHDKNIQTLLEEIISDEVFRNTIVSYNPHSNKKMMMCKLVQEIYNLRTFENIFEGFRPTISELSQYFCK